MNPPEEREPTVEDLKQALRAAQKVICSEFCSSIHKDPCLAIDLVLQ